MKNDIEMIDIIKKIYNQEMDIYEGEKQLLELYNNMNQNEKSHISTLIWCIDEFLDSSHPIRHSNSYLNLK